MASKLLTIKQVAEMIDVSMQTIRRWDKSGKLSSLRKKTVGMRYYSEEEVHNFIKNDMKDLFKLARIWVLGDKNIEPSSDFYCANSAIFQARLSKLEKELSIIKDLKDIFPLISAITGEIGGNSFDHNLGNWSDIPGIFFSYDLDKRKIVLADRGQGILATLKRTKIGLVTHQDALKTAFTEVISGRAPESRGNGLKFVRNVIANNEISLFFQTGDAQLNIIKNDFNLQIEKSNIYIQGCLTLIQF
ncbi:MerR family transcriptional regulator [bacterium]|nr:MAG: MerR family transcriptional regulator [bacterium]